MQKITSIVELKNAISLLEKKKKDETLLLKEDIHIAFESLKPINLLKSTYRDMTSSPELKEDILNSAVGIVAGYLSKKVIMGATRNPLKKLVGSILQMGVSKMVTRNSTGMDFIRKLFNKRADNIADSDIKTVKVR